MPGVGSAPMSADESVRARAFFSPIGRIAIADLHPTERPSHPTPDQYRSAGMRTMTPLYPLSTAATPARNAA